MHYDYCYISSRADAMIRDDDPDVILDADKPNRVWFEASGIHVYLDECDNGNVNLAVALVDKEEQPLQVFVVGDVGAGGEFRLSDGEDIKINILFSHDE